MGPSGWKGAHEPVWFLDTSSERPVLSYHDQHEKEQWETKPEQEKAALLGRPILG